MEALLGQIIENRMNISDFCLISSLKALALAARESSKVCEVILGYDHALDELFDYLKYPHKGIKIQVSSLLATLRVNASQIYNPDAYVQYNVKFLRSSQTKQIYQWILIEMMNQNLGGANNETWKQL